MKPAAQLYLCLSVYMYVSNAYSKQFILHYIFTKIFSCEHRGVDGSNVHYCSTLGGQWLQLYSFLCLLIWFTKNFFLTVLNKIYSYLFQSEWKSLT